MSELPEGWERVQISAIAQVGTGSTPLRSTANFYATNGIPWVTSAATSQAFVANSVEYVTPAAVAAHRLKTYPPGTLLVAMYGEGKTRGQVSELCISATINQACAAIVVDETKALRRYVKLALQTNYMVMRDLAEGGNQPNLNLSKIKEFEIPLPPLLEQARIANQLDTLLTRVQACNNRFDAILALLKRFRQTVLTAATSGVLTAAMRAERGWLEPWKAISLGRLGELGRGKSKHRPRNDPRLYGGEYPFIQTGDVAQSSGVIAGHTQTYSEFGLQQSKLWPAGTICITIAANIADTAILQYPACFPDSVVGFVADGKKCINAFVKWWIDVIKDDLEAFAPATAQKNINLAVLNDVMVQCPSLDEQTEIVRRVEALFALADRIEARCTAVRTQAQRLTPLVLAKAFRGELVQQDPNDEPASVLLARIASSNTAVVGKNKREVPVALKERAQATINL